ncbi:MAG: MFS transporter [Bacteroidota bacterium]
MLKKALPLYLIFTAMGLVDATGPMVSLARESFSISMTMATLLPLFGYIMYALFSIPMGVLQDKKGKKFTMNLGLLIAMTGLLIPVLSGMRGSLVVDTDSLNQFYKILITILFLGAGASILQVSGNPMMRDISDEGHYSRNLALAQSFISVGSSLGFLLPVIMLYLFDMDWSIVFPFFLGIIVISLIWINSISIEEKKNDGTHHASLRSSLKLLRNRYVLAMVLGIFVYCGLEIAMSSHVPILLHENYSVSVEKMGILISWLLLYLPILAGRVLGSRIMRIIAPRRLLIITVLVALSGIVCIFSGSYTLTLIGIFLAGLGFANVFPLIFSLTIERMPKYTNELSGLMVSSVAGGAIIPPIMGLVADNASILIAFIVPVICLLYLLFVALINNRNKHQIN